MKKLTVLLIMLLILTSFAGCALANQASASDSSTAQDSTQLSAQSNIEQEESDDSSGEHVEPPQQLHFDGLEGVEELKDVLSLDDKSIEEYLEKKNFDMNGLRNRQDIETLLEKLGNTCFPTTEYNEPTYITVQPESDQFVVLYELADGERISFRVYMSPDFAKDAINAVKRADIKLDSIEFNDNINVYYLQSTDETDKALTFLMDVDGVCVYARVFDSSDVVSAAKKLKEFEFVSFDVREIAASK